MKPRKHREEVWIALSAKGWPAPFIGYAYQRKTLTLDYERVYGHSLKAGGYRVVKAQLVLPSDRQER